jgi:EpsI family protein
MHRDPVLEPSGDAPASAPGDNRAIWQVISVALLTGLGIVIAVFYSAFAGAVAIWNQSAAHQFSYLVIPVSLYFVWLRRRHLASKAPAPDMRMVWLALPCGLVWLTSHVAQIDIGVQFAALGMLQILMLTLLGREIYRVLLFPLLFLWLLVPFGDSLIVPLMELTSMMTVAGLTLLGLAAHAEGTVLIAEGMRYLIVEECAALDFIIGNLVISLVYANLMYISATKRWLYSLAAVPVAILANGFRTTSIVFITHASDGQIGLAYDHTTYGWIVFLFAVAGQMWAGWRYRDPHVDPPPVEAATARQPSLQRVALTWVVAVVAISAAPGYAAFAATDAASPEVSLCWPALPIDGYAVVENPVWQPRLETAHGNFHALVDSEFGRMDVHIAYYWRQQQGAELINWENRVYDGMRWHFLGSAKDELTVDGQKITVNRELLRGPRYEKRTVFYWYWVDDTLTGSALHAKLLQIKAALFFGDNRAAMIALSVDERIPKQRALEAVQSILDVAPFVIRTLQGVRTTNSGESNC